MPHHVAQRGNYRQQVFYSDAGRGVYLELPRKYCRQEQLRGAGFCLMANHVHLIVIPDTPKAMARALGLAHCRYAQ